MTNNTEKIADFFLQEKGYFFLARLCLKVGRDLTKIAPEESKDPGLLEKIGGAAEELGVSREEFNRAVNSAEVSV